MKLYNTLIRKKQDFESIKDNQVGMYTCGPTVYWYAHIGNLRTYIFEDILKKTLEYNGYKIKHVMNITDVGHLTSDSDTGEDKLEKGARREGKTVWEIADFYTNSFLEDIKKLNIEKADILEKATNTIKEQIELIEKMEEKGFVYKIEDGMYFDTSKLPTYGKLWTTKIENKETRVCIRGKKNMEDFALWKFSPKNKKRQMEWDSPWGIGFPGWHTECIAIAGKHLGIPFDIHCGGIEHIQIHHTNEIAQAEAAYESIPANYWLHAEWLILKEGKMSKSEGNIILVDTLKEKGYNPLAYRYLCLTAHYKSKLTFSWDSLTASQTALNSIYSKIKEYRNSEEEIKDTEEYLKEFKEYISDDLDTPKAIALMHNVIKSNLNDASKYSLLLEFDKIFSLSFSELKKEEIPEDIKELAEKRQEYRQNKDWDMSDKIREELKNKGWDIQDDENEYKIKQG